MHVWMLYNSPTDIHLFNSEDHILPSVRITYSRCTDVKIESKREINDITYEVDFTTPDGEKKHEKLEFKCLPVWESPSHL
jgi:hypothetical protein